MKGLKFLFGLLGSIFGFPPEEIEAEAEDEKDQLNFWEEQRRQEDKKLTSHLRFSGRGNQDGN